jgi:hypothetical protein
MFSVHLLHMIWIAHRLPDSCLAYQLNPEKLNDNSPLYLKTLVAAFTFLITFWRRFRIYFRRNFLG